MQENKVQSTMKLYRQKSNTIKYHSIVYFYIETGLNRKSYFL